jgi:hypothetical protein
MLFRATITAYFENYMKDVNTPCEQNEEILISSKFMYIYNTQCALKT